MKKSLAFVLLVCLLIGFISSGCSPAEEPPPPATQTSKPKPPTSTPEPTSTATEVPAPTSLPGVEVLPLDSFNEGIPWLPYDPARAASVYSVFFNLAKPPFDYVPVRQAFAAAIERDVLIEIAQKYMSNDVSDIRPATNATPPEILGRDLYGEVGILFDPEKAKELLTFAGYEGASDFPPVTLLVNVSNANSPGVHLVIAEEMANMWRENLGVEISVEIVNWGTLWERLNSSDPPEMYRLGFAADMNDPDQFLAEIFSSWTEFNFGSYSNAGFDELVLLAREIADPLERQILYIEAERIVSEIDPAFIPIFHGFYDVR